MGSKKEALKIFERKLAEIESKRRNGEITNDQAKIQVELLRQDTLISVGNKHKKKTLY